MNSNEPISTIATNDSIDQAPPAPATSPQSTYQGIADSDLIDIDQFAKVKLCVGRIEACEAVPKSKKLLRLQVDLGEVLGKRQILSGISQFYTPEQLIGKQIVVVANLKPASMMGIPSQGMLLAASNDDLSSLFVVQPEQQISAGATVR